MGKKFGPIMQMAFIVESFDESIKFWTEKMNVGPFIILDDIKLSDVYYKDKPANIDFSGAIAYTGGMQIELIKQHCDTPCIYNEYVNNLKGPLHHVAALTTDIENDIRILESQGYINLQGGNEREGPMFELVQLSEAGLGFFDMMEQEAKNWDGKIATIEAEVII
jgi:methylmalonyl-CoA/ethylmalonyl-CoA epimerase